MSKKEPRFQRIHLLLPGLFWLLAACSGDDVLLRPVQQEPGFGVSGLLFENNLVMWFRENDGQRSELFPQMYFTRADAAPFPVWGTFPADRLVSGGVPRDGIAALVNPRFVGADSEELGYLRESDLVLGVVFNGEIRAYPENILWWHEIINDPYGQQKTVMSFCPLTGTGIFLRVPENPQTADQLELLPVTETTWAKWKQMYPDTRVLSGETGFNRDYTVYPYGNYRTAATPPLFNLRTGEIDGRFLPKHKVLGLIQDGIQKAYPFSELVRNAVVNDELNGQPLVVVSNTSEALALPYSRVVDGQILTFSESSNRPVQMQDDLTGSTWDIRGEAISGPLKGIRLRQLPAYNAFWFAWAAFWPQTLVLGN